jgi:hypothetical protein
MKRNKVSKNKLERYRAHTYRTKPNMQLETISDAIKFVKQRGFVTLWPIKGINLPSLWTATTGPRPVASEHDDPGHITWGWKDQMLDQRCWYYAKLLRGKATFVSLPTLPNFYALSPREADLDDYRQVYRAGTLSYEALRIADALLDHGPMDTIQLRKRAGLSSSERKSRFDRGLTELQKGLWILPVGIAEAGAWRYAFVYELLDRWYPEIPAQAGYVRHEKARADLVSTYFRAVGVAGYGDVKKVFGWEKSQIRQTLGTLREKGELIYLVDDLYATKLLFERT